MKFIYTLAIAFLSLTLVTGCASKKKIKAPKGSQKTTGARPGWVESPADFCGEDKLCAVGEAGRRFTAEGSARESMAQIFRSYVRGSTRVNTTMETDSQSGSTSEDYSSSIKVSTEEVLKGVEIEETWEDRKNDSWYALASLGKRKAANSFRNEMKTMDETITELFSHGTRAGLNKILRMFKVREELNKRYEIVSGSRFRRPVSVSQVMRKKRAKAAKGVKVFVNLDSKIFKKELKDLMTGLMIENDYKIAPKAGKANYVVKAKLSHQKEHMQAEGFKKYKFRFEVRTVDEKGNKLGALSYKITKPGRNLRNCYQKALPDIKNYLVDNLNQLKID